MGSTICVEKMLLISSYEDVENGIKEWCGVLIAEVEARVYCDDCSTFWAEVGTSTAPSSSDYGFSFSGVLSIELESFFF